MGKLIDSRLGEGLEKHISVGFNVDLGGAGVQQCHFEQFHGKVISVHHLETAITHTSGGGGEIRTHANGFVTGSIDPITSHTRIKTDYKICVRNDESQDYIYSAGYALRDIAEGQSLSLVLLNGEMVGYANHNTNDWDYAGSNARKARISKQRIDKITNAKSIESSEAYIKSGGWYGAFSALGFFVCNIFAENPFWYLIPIALLLWCSVWWRERSFLLNFTGHLFIAFVATINDLAGWGVFILAFIFIMRTHVPRERYESYTDNKSIDTINKVIASNARLLLRNRKKVIAELAKKRNALRKVS